MSAVVRFRGRVILRGGDLAFRMADGLLFFIFDFFLSYVTVHFASARLWRLGAAACLQNLTLATSAVI